MLFKFLELLVKEVDKVQMSQYFGIECDSDDEIKEDSDEEYYSDDEAVRKVIDYNLDTMFEIVNKRDFHHWKLETIRHKWTKISVGDAGRKQISR